MLNDTFKLTFDLIFKIRSKGKFKVNNYRDDENLWEKFGKF